MSKTMGVCRTCWMVGCGIIAVGEIALMVRAWHNSEIACIHSALAFLALAQIGARMSERIA